MLIDNLVYDRNLWKFTPSYEIGKTIRGNRVQCCGINNLPRESRPPTHSTTTIRKFRPTVCIYPNELVAKGCVDFNSRLLELIYKLIHLRGGLEISDYILE